MSWTGPGNCFLAASLLLLRLSGRAETQAPERNPLAMDVLNRVRDMTRMLGALFPADG